jgi:hypothetical protein
MFLVQARKGVDLAQVVFVVGDAGNEILKTGIGGKVRPNQRRFREVCRDEC